MFEDQGAPAALEGPVQHRASHDTLGYSCRSGVVEEVSTERNHMYTM